MKKITFFLFVLSLSITAMAIDSEADWTKIAPYDTQWSTNAATHELNFTGSAPTSGTKAAITTYFNNLVVNPANTLLNQYAGLKLTFDAYVSGNSGDVTSVIFGWNSANAKGCHIQVDKDKIQVVGIAASTITTIISDGSYMANVNLNAYNSFEINVAADGLSFTVKINSYTCPTTLTSTINANAIGRLTLGVTPTGFCSTFTNFKLRNVVASRLGIVKEYFTYTTPVTLNSDWWPQIGQETTPPAINGWYNNGANNSLNFEGTILAGTRIATTLGTIGSPYTGVNLKFDASIDIAGGSTQIILGSNNGYPGTGILINLSKYSVQALKNFEYGTAVNLSSDVATYQALLAGGGLRSFEINVSATGLITVTVAGYVCPTNYQADVAILGGSFVLVCPAATGFKMANFIAKKGAITKKYFGTQFTGSLYFDAINGNDDNTGFSEAEAWKTFNNINSTILAAGTKVLLKKGSVWNQRLEIRGAGTANNWITVGAYGTDPAKPKISLTNNANDIGLLICDLDKTSGVAKQQSISYIEVKDLEISNTRLGIFYRNVVATTNTGFRVSNVTFNNINCDAVMTAINSAADKHAEISNQLSAVKGNLQTLNGAADGGAYEYVFPAAIFVGGQTFGTQTVTGNHTTVLTEFEVTNCQFNEAIAGVMSAFYFPFVSGTNIWRQLVYKVKISNCSSTGIVNGVIAFDGVNAGAIADAYGVMQPDANGWGLMKNVRVTMGSAVSGRTWPDGTTGMILNNSQNILIDSCEFSGILNQGNPDGCGLDFESNNNLITVQNTKFINNDGHSILLMNGGSFGGNSNLVIQKNLFAQNVKFSNSTYELMLGQTSDNGGTHSNVKIRNNIVFMRKLNKNNQNIGFYNTSNRAYVTATDNDRYYLEPTAGNIPVSFLGQLYSYNAQNNVVAVPVVSVISANGGASKTTIQNIQIYSEITKAAPAYYMASESPSFVGANWLTYNSTINFNLSAGLGSKIVYFKVINAAGESNIAQISIQLDMSTSLFGVKNSNPLVLNIYPNPISSFANISINSAISDQKDQLESDTYQISVLSLTGRILEQTQQKGSSFNLDFSRYAAGTYLIRLKGTKNVFTKTVVKR